MGGERDRPGRRVFLGAAASMALLASARRPAAQGRAYRVGYLSGGADASQLAQALAPLGYVEGRNLRIELRIAEFGSPKLAASAEDLVRSRPHALVAFGAERVAALQRATSTIPIVCGFVADPVKSGFARSLARPGSNVTGLSLGLAEVAAFQLDLLRALLPDLARLVGITRYERERGAHNPIVEAATRAGLEWEDAVVRTRAEALALFEGRADRRTTAGYVYRIDDFLKEVVLATLSRGVVTIATLADLARQGLLMSYSLTFTDAMGKVAAVLDRILRGANPAEMPFEQADRTDFVLNRATARAIGVRFPAEMLLRATEIVG